MRLRQDDKTVQGGIVAALPQLLDVRAQETQQRVGLGQSLAQFLHTQLLTGNVAQHAELEAEERMQGCCRGEGVTGDVADRRLADTSFC